MHLATALMRAYRRRVWLAGTCLRQALLEEAVGISGKVTEVGTGVKCGTDGHTLRQRTGADAEGRILDAREGLRAGAVKAEACSPSRNSGQV